MGLIGRQSISDNSYMMFGYDIMFRDESVKLSDRPSLSISTSVLDRILHEFGLDNIVGGYTGLMRVDVDFLKTDMILALPKESFCLMLLETSLDDPRLPDILQSHARQGYRFGINDLGLNELTMKYVHNLAPWIEIVKLDTLRTTKEWAEQGCQKLHEMNKKIIAAKVENFESFEFYDSIGADYFQGYYIKRPHVVQGESLNATEEQTWKIWNLLQQDCDTDEIVTGIEQNHVLALQLMRFINSSYFAFKAPVTTIRQIITLLGRKALGNWILLLIMAHRDGQNVNHPLLLMVINRTEIMTGLVKLTRPNATRKEFDTAYLVGMLSLIHLLLNMEHRAFLRKINAAPEIEEAMFEAQGEWGQLLTMTRYIENMDLDSLTPFIKKFRIDEKQMDRLIADAMEKVNAFDALLNSEF